MIKDQIRAARKEAGLTQRELSEKTGIAEPTIRCYESGKLNPKYETVKNIANALGVSVFKLLDPEMYESYISELEGQRKRCDDMLAGMERIRETPEALKTLGGEEVLESLRKSMEESRMQVNLQIVAAQAGNNAYNAQKAAEQGKSKKRLRAEKLLKLYSKLNAKGQQEAIRRVDEMSRLPEYAEAGKPRS